jgi:ATP-dependent DNA helicase PIF1
MLTEYFVVNQRHACTWDILYKYFPGRFTWQPTKYWKKRDKGQQVGRILLAHPAEGERYFLRVLLNHVPGLKSFEDLKIVDGVLCDTFCEATERKGLIEADSTLDECLTESKQFAMPASLRRLFATILVFYEAGDVRGLWDRHLEAMSDDYRSEHKFQRAVEHKVLINIRGMPQSVGKDIKSYPLPDIDETYDNTEGEGTNI